MRGTYEAFEVNSNKICSRKRMEGEREITCK